MSVKGFFSWLALAVLACSALDGQAATCSPSCPTASANGAITSTIMGPVTVASSANLAFGTVVRPATSAGNGTVTVNTSGTRSLTGTGLALASSTATRARFTVTGEGASTVSLSLPTSISLTSGANTITVTLTRSPSSATSTLSNSAGTDGTLTVSVGGSFPLTNTSVPAAYSGSMTLTAAYQ